MKKIDFSGNYNIFPRVSILLISVSVILLVIALINDRHDFTTAMLVVVSMANFMTGIIIFSFSGPEGIPPDIVSMLYPSLVIDKTGLFSELNVYGDACFIPKNMTDAGETLQFNPAGEYIKFNYKKSHFSTDDETTAGIFSKPSSSGYIEYLTDNCNFRIPTAKYTPGAAKELLKEVLIDITPLCEDIELNDNGEDIIIQIKNPAFFSGCHKIRSESPKCCTSVPCPFCSIICSVIAEYYEEVVALSAIITENKKKEILIILKVPSHQSKGEGPDNLS